MMRKPLLAALALAVLALVVAGCAAVKPQEAPKPPAPEPEEPPMPEPDVPDEPPVPDEPEEPVCGGTTDSTDHSAPKHIESTEMTSFYCTVNVMSYDLDDYPELYEPRYSFTASLENDGAERMAAIQDIVSRYDFAQFNGHSSFTHGLPDDFGATIDIEYASGESIYASDNQEMFLSLDAVRELVLLLREKLTYESITMDEAAKLMEERDDYRLIDVRTWEEYAEGHIPGAYLLPLDEIDSLRGHDSPFGREELLLIYCRSGRRSKLAAEALCEMGYSNVVEIGGILDWKGEIEE